MNKLFFGDNLDVLRKHVKDETINLVYLDPPFNSQAKYNLLYETPGNERETAQQTIFRDMWSWEDEAEYSYREVLAHGGRVGALVEALTVALRRSDMMAYLAMMAARLIEFRRVLKPTGSLYLHCDPAASHYIKMILDAIFGYTNFRNDVIWKRTFAHGGAARWGDIHDDIFFYTVSDKYTWNRALQAHDEAYLDNKYRFHDERGRYRLVVLTGPGATGGASGQPWRGYNPSKSDRHWAVPKRALELLREEGETIPRDLHDQLELLFKRDLIRFPQKRDGGQGVPEFKLYLPKGQPIQDIILDIPPVNSQAKERIGYPTQKPVALLQRIIAASSNEGDMVLDPFCGCGTTVHAAETLKRQWIGIDVSYYAARLIQRRVVVNFGPSHQVPISGIPADLASAEGLAEREPYGFQQWIVGELGCQLWNDGKKGADSGIDGEMRFYDPPQNTGRLLVQVKAGKNINPDMVRAFIRVLDRERAALGIFFCRATPTDEMRKEARMLEGTKVGGKTFTRLQICSLTEWYAGQRPELPVPVELTIPKDRSRPTKHARRPDPRQPQFTFVLKGSIAGDPKRGQVLNPAMLPDDALKAS
jgi:DNA modification methylase